MKELLPVFRSGQYKKDLALLDKYKRSTELKQDSFLRRVRGILNELMLYEAIYN
jgi:hypothetical protein